MVTLMDKYAAGYSILFAVFFETLAVSWAYGKPIMFTLTKLTNLLNIHTVKINLFKMLKYVITQMIIQKKILHISFTSKHIC